MAIWLPEDGSGRMRRPLPLAARRVRLLALAGLAFLAGCATGRPARDPTASAIVRPDAPASYDFLVAREKELAGKLEEALAAYTRAIEKDPDSPYLFRRYADLAWRLGRFEEALDKAERAYDLGPGDPDARLFLGKLYRMRKDAARAEEVLRDDAGDPIGLDASLLLYSMYLESDRGMEALDLARWMIEREPSGLRGYFALSRAYEQLDRPADAEAALRRGLAFDPENLSFFSALARLHRERGDRAAEIGVYRETLAAYPHHHGSLVGLADALIAQNDPRGAREALEEVLRYHPEDIRSVIRLALLEFDAGATQSAAARFERALATNPEEYEIAYFLGVIHNRLGADERAVQVLSGIPPHHARFSDAQLQLAGIAERRGDLEAAIGYAREALRTTPNRQLELYAAQLQARSGDLEGAVARLEARLAERPDDDELLYTIGLVYGEARRLDEALQYMQRALEKNPNNPSVLNYIGYTWAERGERLDEAEQMIHRALALRPDDGYITDSLGWVYYMRALPLIDAGEVDRGHAMLHDALRQLERAEQLTGGDPVISEHIGDVYLLLDQKQRALERYRDAIGRDPRASEQPDLQLKYERLRLELEAR